MRKNQNYFFGYTVFYFYKTIEASMTKFTKKKKKVSEK